MYLSLLLGSLKSKLGRDKPYRRHKEKGCILLGRSGRGRVIHLLQRTTKNMIKLILISQINKIKTITCAELHIALKHTKKFLI